VSVLVVTGTGTGVGKTIVTAAIAALAAQRGAPTAVVKIAQTGVRDDEPGDLQEIERLTGVHDLHEFARYPDPLAPVAAARLAARPEVDLDKAVAEIGELAAIRRLVLVEGAGGLLVRYDSDGRTLADVARMLGAPVLVVVDAGLGSLNHTALTLEALAHRGLELAGLVVGSWPSAPDLAMRSNLVDLTALAARPLAGLMADNMGALMPRAFVAAAKTGLGPYLGGSFDASDFVRTHRPDQPDH
jgi:dethiobiotin synthetase